MCPGGSLPQLNLKFHLEVPPCALQDLLGLIGASYGIQYYEIAKHRATKKRFCPSIEVWGVRVIGRLILYVFNTVRVLEIIFLTGLAATTAQLYQTRQTLNTHYLAEGN